MTLISKQDELLALLQKYLGDVQFPMGRHGHLFWLRAYGNGLECGECLFERI